MVFADEFKGFFSKYGKVVENEIIRDHATKRSRGFGFIVFDNEEVVDNLLANANMIDMAGTQVSSVQWVTQILDVGRQSFSALKGASVFHSKMCFIHMINIFISRSSCGDHRIQTFVLGSLWTFFCACVIRCHNLWMEILG